MHERGKKAVSARQHLKLTLSIQKLFLSKYIYHQRMYESLYFPKFGAMKHFDTVTLLDSRENPLQPNLDNIKGLALERTEASMEQKEKHKTRSCKVLADPLNISFEEPYMDEHKACFQKQLQKYMEHQQNILGSLNPEGLKRKSYELHQIQNSNINIPAIINEHGSLLTQVQKQMLIIDLKREDKLSEFLEFVFQKVNEESIKDIIYLVNLIWENYFPLQQMCFSQHQTIQFAQNLILKHLEQIDQKVTQINYKAIDHLIHGKSNSSQNKQRLAIFKKFATFFTTTILMVIDGYFENPYTDTEQNYYKRELDVMGIGYQNEDEFKERDFDSDDDQIIINKRIKH